MRRPWNIVNTPVYALLTRHGQEYNANICTYVMAVSRRPKLYAVAVEHHSKTLELLRQHDQAVLQMLSLDQIKLVSPLGKKTGYKYSKKAYLERENHLVSWQNWPVIKGAAANLLLEIISQQTTGDHELFIMKVIRYQTLQEHDILMFDHLVDQKVIL